MISFNNDYEPTPSNQDDLKKMIFDAMNELGTYAEGSFHGGLSPSNIQDIIALIMYSEDCDHLNITISKAEDDYHLNLSINKKN
tara:strand:+ start:224 stop:475 length:252 start_codon:yes stop_codon:yes gene_type:complete